MKYLVIVLIIIIGVLVWKLDSNSFEKEQELRMQLAVQDSLVKENNYYKKTAIPALSSKEKIWKDSINTLVKEFDREFKNIQAINQITFSSQEGKSSNDSIRVDTLYIQKEIVFPILDKPLPFLVFSGYFTSYGRYDFDFKTEELQLTIVQEKVKDRLVTYLHTEGLRIAQNTFFYDLNDIMPKQEKVLKFTPFIGLKNSLGIMGSYKKINLGFRSGNTNEILIGWTL